MSSPGLPAGTRFGEFVAVRPLAAGGMAELYLAARGRGGAVTELVAVKRLLPHLGWDPEFVRMFLDEVRIAASLQHPNIVRVVDFGVGEGGHYLAMEYLHGRTLRSVQRSVGQMGALPLGFSLGIIMEVAAGLHAAHEHRDPDGNAVEVVHRDVSPTNVMVTFDGQVKLLDFGIARVTQQTQLTRAGTLKGKMGYMSPEQCRGEPVDRRSDVFGLGILLYELTVGRRAFYADNDYAVIGKVVDGDYVPPGRAVPGYPAALEAVIARALEVEPADRHASAAELAEELRHYAGATGLDVWAPSRATELQRRFGFEPFPQVDLAALSAAESSPSRSRSLLRWVALAGVGVVIGVVGFVAGGLAQTDADAEPSPAGAASEPASPAVAAAPAGVETPVPEPDPKLEPEPPLPQPEPVEPPAEDEGIVELELSDSDSTGMLADEGTESDGAEPTAPSRRRGRGRKKTKPRQTPSGDPDPLLPPTWREE